MTGTFRWPGGDSHVGCGGAAIDTCPGAHWVPGGTHTLPSCAVLTTDLGSGQATVDLIFLMKTWWPGYNGGLTRISPVIT